MLHIIYLYSIDTDILLGRVNKGTDVHNLKMWEHIFSYFFFIHPSQLIIYWWRQCVYICRTNAFRLSKYQINIYTDIENKCSIKPKKEL